jgi:hypothetical protein
MRRWGSGAEASGAEASGAESSGEQSQEGKQAMLQLENETLMGDHWAVGTVGH